MINPHTDSWKPAIVAWLPGRERVLMSDLLEQAIGIQPSRQDQLATKRAGRILRAIGWHSRPLRNGAGRLQKFWLNDSELPEDAAIEPVRVTSQVLEYGEHLPMYSYVTPISLY